MILAEIISKFSFLKDMEIAVSLNGKDVGTFSSIYDIPIEFKYKEVTDVNIKSMVGFMYADITLID